MTKVEDLFSRTMIDDLDEDEISRLAAESSAAAASRSKYTTKLDVLRAGFEDLKRLNRHRTGIYRKSCARPSFNRLKDSYVCDSVLISTRESHNCR